MSKHVRGDRRPVADQDKENDDACAEEGWSVGELHCDNDMSVSRFSRKARQDWDRFLEDLPDRRFEVLVLWESSRGDRKLARWIYLLDLCRDLGVLIHITSHERTYDVRKRRDYRTLAEEGLDSADDSEKTSVRLRRDKQSVAQKGLPHGRHLSVIHYLSHHLPEVYREVKTRRFSTLIRGEFDPETLEVLSSERATPYYRHEQS